jgi:hypothetical protein
MRIGAAMTAATLTVLVPATAWAAERGVLDVADEIARRRPRMGGFGLLAGLCCLLVVAGVVVAVLLIMRGRRRR